MSGAETWREWIEAAPSEPMLPAMLFGDGAHPTTRMAAMALREALRQRHAARGVRVLDVGTGGGILAAMAVAGGASEVVGIDHDAAAIAGARRAVPGARFVCADAGDWLAREGGGAFDVVVANLPDPPLIRLVPALSAAARFGTLIVTGALLWQGDALRRELTAAGLTAGASRHAAGWCCVVAQN
jgi:ribosomal protein L11 methylase PrmA